MAVTGVYASVSRIPQAGLPDDLHTISNIAATTAAFFLRGGRYGIRVVGATFGTLTLQAQGDDATPTWLTAMAFTANGTALVDLPPGNYRWLFA